MRKVIFAAFLLISIPVYAVQLADDDRSVHYVKADFNGDGIEEEVKLNMGIAGEDQIPTCQLEFVTADKIITKDIAIMFANACNVSKLEVSPQRKPFIAVDFPSGIHGWVLELYTLDGEELRESADIFSDAPFIEVRDIDGDGAKEIIAKTRDYNNDPVNDRFTKVYKYVDNGWQTGTGTIY